MSARARAVIAHVVAVWLAGIVCLTAMLMSADTLTLYNRQGEPVTDIERAVVLGAGVALWPVTVPAVLAAGAIR